MKKEKEPIKKVISGYKAFDKDLKCLNLQYKVGDTFSINKDKILKCCPDENKNEAGLHFCENPLDLFPCFERKTPHF